MPTKQLLPKQKANRFAMKKSAEMIPAPVEVGRNIRSVVDEGKKERKRKVTFSFFFFYFSPGTVLSTNKR